MDTILFNSIIFGPVQSRRLGKSLGINLLPDDHKICNFDCIYCECGWNQPKNKSQHPLPSREQVSEALEEAMIRIISNNETVDYISFAGNGEPTLHPYFKKIMEDTVALRNKYLPQVKIAVLSNAALLNKKHVLEGMLMADLPIMKLDAGTEETFTLINQPVGKRTLRWIINHLHYFRGNLAIQTLFFKGNYNNKYIDNTTNEEVTAWLEILTEIKPKMVMIYSLDRNTPAKNLEVIPRKNLIEIAARAVEKELNAYVY
jgi:wyosine [tRNA(Phe)-imidazoG37] synthetase (radical SAM superfamily)